MNNQYPEKEDDVTEVAVRLPGDVVEAAGLQLGERVEIQTSNGNIMIRRMPTRISLEEPFRGNTAEEWRAE
jgi:antitoxin component of MazEF toxin-antitoxin module